MMSFLRLPLCAYLCALSILGAEHSGIVRAGQRPVPGATVTATRGAETQTTITDEGGAYQLDLDPGDWKLSIQMFGFAPAEQGLRVGADATRLQWSLTFGVPIAKQAPAPPAQLQRRPPPGSNGAAPPPQQRATEEAAIPVLDRLTEESSSSESFLINGSLSRGLEAPRQEDYSFPGMMPPAGPRGPGMGPGEGSLDGTSSSDFLSSRTSDIGARGATGFGGPGGGGPGGGGPGGGGFGRGPGGGGPGGRFGNMTPEQRARMMDRMRQARAGGFGQAFGNRRQRNRETIRGMLSYQIGNSAFDARAYSLSGEKLDKPSYAQNRIQLMLGGTLKIPKLIDSNKTFFQLMYSGNFDRSPFSGTGTVPTAAERSGDLSRRSETIYDPLTGQPFSNNVIPASRINTAAAGLLSYIPLPNASGAVQNYSYATALDRDATMLNLRLNHTPTPKHRLSGGFSLQSRTSEIGQLYGWTDTVKSKGWAIDLGWNYSISAQLIHDLRLRLNRDRSQTFPYFSYTQNVAGALGIEGPSTDPINWGPPNLGFTNYGDLSDASANLRRNQTFSLSDSLNIVRGSHTLIVGAEFRRLQLNTNAYQDARGSFSFTGLLTSALDEQGRAIAGTGYDLADYLLGLPQSSSIRYSSTDTYFRGSAYVGYVQDEWRARSNLTFNLGLRYEYVTPYSEKFGHLANLDVAAGFTGVSVVTPGVIGPFSGAFPDSLIDSDRNNFAPRFGFAWRPKATGKTVLRGGYSMFYDGTSYGTIATQLAGQPPFAQTSSLTTSPQRVLTINDGFGVDDTNLVTNTYAVGRNFRLPYAQTWNFAVQRDLPFNLMLEVGYLGTKGTRLDILRQPNRAFQGSALTAEERRLADEAGNYTYKSSEGNSIFHAAQVRLNRRLGRGMSVQAFYTYSKSIDNASSIGGSGNIIAQDDRNLSAERGLSNFDQRHNLRLTGLINSPFGEGAHWLRDRSLASRLLRDWTLSGSINAHSGRPFTARVLGNLADVAGTGSVGSGRADATGLPITAEDGFLNLAAFTLPQSGRFGNAGRNTIPGPGFFSLGTSFGRQFRLSERKRLEIRIQGENLLNSVNYTSINTVVNSIQYGIPTATSGMRTITANVRFRF